MKFHPFLMLLASCTACGASFTASDGGSVAGSGNTGSAGEASGGSPTTSAGSSSAGDAGEAELGGSSSAGQGSTAGAGGSVSVAGSGSGGSNSAGWGSGGRWNNNGGASSADCARLRQDFSAALEKARACDKGSTDQCSPSSVIQPIGCGCPTLVNAKSSDTEAAKKAYQALQDSKCDYGGGVICNIACPAITSATCGSSASNTFVCTSNVAIQN